MDEFITNMGMRLQGESMSGRREKGKRFIRTKDQEREGKKNE